MNKLFKVLIALFLGILFVISTFTANSEIIKKKEKEKVSIEDLEELGVYVEFKTEQYPEQMYLILKKGCGKGIRCKAKNAARYLAKAFSRGQNYKQRLPDNIIKAMAMYEIFYLGKLKENERYLVRYKENWPNNYGFRKKKMRLQFDL
jgi:hypothetical protein